MTVEGSLVTDESSLIASLEDAFSKGEFLLRDDRKAAMAVTFDFRFAEVFDDLLPPRSGVRLFEGSCGVTVFEKGRKVSASKIPSKVTSGRDPGAVHARIAAFLLEKAVESAAALLEPLVE